MKDQIAMSKTNGQLVVAVPLFRIQNEESLGNLDGYRLMLTNSKPIAYAIDCDVHGIKLMNADFVEKHLEFLGDL